MECRADDTATRHALVPLDDAATHAAVVAERSLLKTLRGGCLAPIRAWARSQDELLTLDAVVLNAAGSDRRIASGQASVGDAAMLGQRLAEELLAVGAGELIADSRSGS